MGNSCDFVSTVQCSWIKLKKMAVKVVRMISGLPKEHQQQTTIRKPSLVYQEASVMIGYFELVVIIASLRKCNIEYGVDLFIYKCFQLTAECDQQKYDTLPSEQLTITRQNLLRKGRAYCRNIDSFISGCDSIIADNTTNFSLHAFTYFNCFRLPSKPATTVVCRAWRLVNWVQFHKFDISISLEGCDSCKFN